MLVKIFVLVISNKQKSGKCKALLECYYVLYKHSCTFVSFVINSEKSCLEPKHLALYLGFEIDTLRMIFIPPRDKVSLIHSKGALLLKSETVTIRDFGSLIGSIVSSFFAFSFGKLHFRSLEWTKTKALQDSNNHVIMNLILLFPSIQR